MRLDIQPIINLVGSLNQECTCIEPYQNMPYRTDPQCEFHSIGGDEIEAAIAWLTERVNHWRIFETMGHDQKVVDGVYFDAQVAERQRKLLNRDNALLKYHVQAFAPTANPIPEERLKSHHWDYTRPHDITKYPAWGWAKEGDNFAIFYDVSAGITLVVDKRTDKLVHRNSVSTIDELETVARFFGIEMDATYFKHAERKVIASYGGEWSEAQPLNEVPAMQPLRSRNGQLSLFGGEYS